MVDVQQSHQLESDHLGYRGSYLASRSLTSKTSSLPGFHDIRDQLSLTVPARRIRVMSERTRRIILLVLALASASLAVPHGGHGVEINSAVAAGCFFLCAVMAWWPWPWRRENTL